MDLKHAQCKGKTEVLLVATQGLGLEIKDEKAKYMVLSRE